MHFGPWHIMRIFTHISQSDILVVGGTYVGGVGRRGGRGEGMPLCVGTGTVAVTKIMAIITDVLQDYTCCNRCEEVPGPVTRG